MQNYLNDVHGVLLDMMIDLDEFMREHNLPYSIAYGTMLGAVRHGGFIPWDDDVDILMKRDDYERFIKIYHETGGIDAKGYTLYATDDENSWLTHTKLYKNNTALLGCYEDLFAPETKENKYKGVFIDVFPLDKVPINKRKRKKYMFRAKMRLVYTRDHAYQATNNKLLWLVSKILLSIPKSLKNKIKKKTNKYMLKFNGMQDGFYWVATVDPFSMKDYFPADLGNIIDADFEGHKFAMYSKYDELLRITYGDYMKLPMPEDRKPKGGRSVVILDVEKYLSGISGNGNT